MTTQAKRYEMYTAAKNMVAGVATLEWMEAALRRLIEQEDAIRSHFSCKECRYYLTPEHKLDGYFGICTYIKPHWVHCDIRKGVNRMLDILWDGDMYPINVAGDCRTAMQLFQGATPKGMWSKGAYADARWAEVKQLHIAVKSVLKSLEE